MANFTAILDDKEVKKFMKQMNDRLRVPAKMLRTVANIFAFKDIIDHFKKQTGQKSRWKPRTDSTQQMYQQIRQGSMQPPEGASRASFNPANKILQLTGMLRKSFVNGNAKVFKKDAVILQSAVKYSGKHDLGLQGMTKRDFMWTSNKADKLMLKSILNLLAEGKV